MAKLNGVTKTKADAVNADVLSGTTLDVNGNLYFVAEDSTQHLIGKIAEDPIATVPAIVSVGSIDQPAAFVTVPEWFSSIKPTIKVPDPATMPPAGVYWLAWSPDGKYLAVAFDSVSPFIYIYSRSGDVLSKLANPASLPGDWSSVGAWSPDGKYLALSTNASPWFIIYKRSGSTFTKLPDQTYMPPNRPDAVTWSPDGQYLAISIFASPYLVIYKKDATGDTFTKLANQVTMPSGTIGKMAFSHGGQYLFVTLTASPWRLVYKRSGDTFTPITPDPISGTGSAYTGSVTWSPDDKYVCIGNYVFKRTGDTFSQLSSQPQSAGVWSPDGRYFTTYSALSPFILIYKFENDIFTQLPDPQNLPGDRAISAWSPDGILLAVANYFASTGPWLLILKSSMLEPKGSPVAIQLTP